MYLKVSQEKIVRLNITLSNNNNFEVVLVDHKCNLRTFMILISEDGS